MLSVVSFVCLRLDTFTSILHVGSVFVVVWCQHKRTIIKRTVWELSENLEDSIHKAMLWFCYICVQCGVVRTYIYVSMYVYACRCSLLQVHSFQISTAKWGNAKGSCFAGSFSVKADQLKAVVGRRRWRGRSEGDVEFTRRGQRSFFWWTIIKL